MDSASASTTGDMVDAPTPSTKANHRSSGRRTHRACDRCRVKKSKCNGQQPCNTCKTNERTCVFSALRRRDIRKWHCHMQDTVDEAIQRLYRACKAGACFPGILPDEKDGFVTTESILQGMGFTNLDIGPQSAGFPVSATLPHLPIQQKYPGGPVDGNRIASFSVYHSSRGPQNSHSDEPSAASPTSTESPHLPPGFHVLPMSQSTLDQHASAMALPMSEQFSEAVKNEPSDEYLRHHYQPHHQEHYRLTIEYNHHGRHPYPQQDQQRDWQQQQQQQQQRHAPESMDRIPHFSPTRSHFPSMDGVMQPSVSMELKEHHRAPPCYVFDGGPFINPEQVWSSHYETATASQ